MEWIRSLSDNIRTEHIALFSAIITIIIFILNKHSELRYKKYEAKKGQYIKVIEMLNTIYGGSQKDKVIL